MASRILLLTAALICNLAAADQGLDEASNTTLPILPEGALCLSRFVWYRH